MARVDRRNCAKFWCYKQVPGFSLMHAHFTSHDYGWHIHEAFVIAATDAGGAHIKSRNTVESVASGTLFVSNPGEPQSSWMGDSECWRYRSIPELGRRSTAAVPDRNCCGPHHLRGSRV